MLTALWINTVLKSCINILFWLKVVIYFPPTLALPACCFSIMSRRAPVGRVRLPIILACALLLGFVSRGPGKASIGHEVLSKPGANASAGGKAITQKSIARYNPANQPL